MVLAKNFSQNSVSEVHADSVTFSKVVTLRGQYLKHPVEYKAPGLSGSEHPQG
jgi:hypothetical protein